MRIRKLEIQGFKSFADRAVFHFGPGISGVVGPNGCGKSNIVDAVKWCIGEQSARSLRGESMSDVIFAGSASRAPVNLAEVSLTFVAGDEPFPGIWARFPEVDVTRRLYRDGHSEYLVNQERVRLRDVVDLFLDTGVNNQLYSFIEQGRIGQIVHARPEQRRTLIEEAAGISRYKQRRDETLGRLEETRQTLDRVADLAEELGRQLRSAQRQVERAWRWRWLSVKVRQEEVAVALARCAGLLADRKALSEQVRQAGAAVEEAQRTVDRVEQQLDAARTALEAAEESAARARDRLADLEAQRRVEESALQYQEREAVTVAERLKKLGADQEAVRTERDRAQAEAEAAGRAREEADASLARARREAEALGVEAQALDARVDEARRELDAARGRAVKGLETAVAARAEAAALGERRADLERRKAELERRRAEQDRAGGHQDEEIGRHAAALAAARERADAVRARVEAARLEVQRAERDRDEAVGAARAAEARLGEAVRGAERALAEAIRQAQARGAEGVARAEAATHEAVRRAMAEAAQAVAEAEARAARRMAEVDAAHAPAVARAEAERRAARDTEARLRARVESLEELERRHAELPDAARAALAVEGSLGLLVDGIEVPEGLEGVMARAAEGGLHAVRVRDEAAALAAVRAARGGRVRVLLPGAGAEAPGEVGGDPAARADLGRILGRFQVVDDAEAAVRAWTPGLRVASRDGTVVRPDGLLVMGEEAAGAAGLERRRALAGLRLALEAAEREAAAAEARLAEREEARRSAVEAARAEGEAEVAEVRARGPEAEAAARAAGAEAVGRARQAAEAGVRAATEAGERKVAEARRVGEEALAAARSAVEGAEAAVRAAARGLEDVRAEQREVELAVAEARHRLEGQRAERAAAVRAVEGLRAEVEQLERGMVEVAAALAAAEARRGAAEAEQEAAEEAARGWRRRLDADEPALARAQEALTATRLQAAGFQRDLAAATAAEAAALARAERAAARSTQVAAERGDLEARAVSLAAERAATRERLQALGEQVGAVRVELDAWREQLRALREKVRGLDVAAREARDRREAARTVYGERERALAEVRATLDRLRGDVEERHAVSLPGLLDRIDRDGQLLLDGWTPEPVAGLEAPEPIATLRVTAADLEGDVRARAAELATWKEQLQRLGEVNLEAEGEYREIAERHAEIARQRADLEEAMGIIEQTIARLNRTCRERFRETFDRVDAHFAEIYPRLVGGGLARLELTDEDDLLTTGVEIVVQPPGKRVQNLSLLSGGEKAMAAIALIFALFQVKPSPFCLLDEVDAPLDEANGARFNETLKVMSRRSQFIVVTHNRKTMEAADVLYGVTMPEPGISRLVSVRID